MIRQTGPVGGQYYGDSGATPSPPNDPFGKKQVFPPQVTIGSVSTKFTFQLDFSASTLDISNLSNFWLYIDAAQMYIPPQSLGALYALPYPLSYFDMVVKTPQGGLGGFALPTVNGLVFVTAYENKLADYAGVLSLSTIVSSQLPTALNGGKFSTSVDGWGGVGVGGAGLPLDGSVLNNGPNVIAAEQLLNPAGTYDIWRGDATKGAEVNEHANTTRVFVAGAPNTAATLTLPAPGAGLFHYITYLRISRVATAALAGANILAVTTTNLGGIQYRTGDAMAAGGTVDLINMDFSHSMKSAAANVASTFVGPAPGLAVSWDMEAHYFTAP